MTTREELSPEERSKLRGLRDVVNSIDNCRFIRDFDKQPHHIFVGRLPDGTIKDEYPRYDDDDLRAFLTHYRKLRLQGEPTHLPYMINIVRRVSNAEDKAKLDYLKNEIREEGRAWWGATLQDESGQQIFVTQEVLDDYILNGDVFHSDSEMKEALDRIKGTSGLPKTIAFLNYLRFVRCVVWCSKEVVELVKARGYLDEPDTSAAQSKSSPIDS